MKVKQRHSSEFSSILFRRSGVVYIYSESVNIWILDFCLNVHVTISGIKIKRLKIENITPGP